MAPENLDQTRWLSENILPHEGALRAWLHKCFPHTEGIDDVIHDAYLKLLKLYRSSEIRSPKALLFRTTRNLLLDELKSHRISRHISYDVEKASVVIEGERSIPDTVARQQELRILKAAMESLPPRCRQIMTLHEVYGMPQREIAEELDVSASLVSNQVAIGLQKCMAFVRKYEKDGGDLP